MRETDKGMLMDVMNLPKNGAITTDGCDNIAAEDGNVECLRLAHELGGSLADVCNIAAKVWNNGNVFAGSPRIEAVRSSVRVLYAAAYGHVECCGWLVGGR